MCLITCTALVAHAVDIKPAILSDYGQIQNVQNYSSNPFYNPAGSYNQRIAPIAINAKGPDLDAGDCQRTVATLITLFCDANNRCKGMQLSDVRPSLMIQMSQLPGHNYAVECAGYLDSAFQAYMSNNSANTPSAPVAFPTASVPNPNATNDTYQIKNPFATQPADWQIEQQQREQELQRLQQAYNTKSNRVLDKYTLYADNRLTHTAFPKTADDISFIDRTNLLREGYEPYKNAKAFQEIQIQSREEWLAEKAQKARVQQEIDRTKLSFEDYCNKYPTDTSYCHGTPNAQHIDPAVDAEIRKLASALRKYQRESQ